MKRFATLYRALDQTTSTNIKLAALRRYFESVPPADAAWAVYFLSGRRFKRMVGPANLRQWMIEASNLPAWLVEETYASVGDLAETAALLTDTQAPTSINHSLSEWMEKEMLVLGMEPPDQQRLRIQSWWQYLDYDTCYLVNKLLTGSLRVGVSHLLVARALADSANLPRPVILHRLMGHWEPTPQFYDQLTAPDDGSTDHSRPYPFCLASPLEQQKTLQELKTQLGDAREWLVEWKWDGIRAQLLRRPGACYIWTRGEELVTDRYPEARDAAYGLPDGTVLDGEILAWSEETGVMPFTILQRRLGRKTVGKKLLQDIPICFMAYDLIEHEGQDMRQQTTTERRALLDMLLDQAGPVLKISPLLSVTSWEEAAQFQTESRGRLVEGLMLKHRNAMYEVGRRRGHWWKWKITPHTLDMVMMYAQPGHGRRANLYTDYTFGVWQDQELVPIAKAYSGLTNEEIYELDKWIRQHTLKRFGPVRAVKPEQVFELAFEAINRSSRHKSGVAVRFPRITRWRRDLHPKDADSLADVHSLSETGNA